MLRIGFWEVRWPKGSSFLLWLLLVLFLFVRNYVIKTFFSIFLFLSGCDTNLRPWRKGDGLRLGISSDKPILSLLIPPCRRSADICGVDIVTAQAWCVLNDHRWIGNGQCQLAWIRKVEGIGGDFEATNSYKRLRINGFVNFERHVNAFEVIYRVIRDRNAMTAMTLLDEKLDQRSVCRHLARCVNKYQPESGLECLRCAGYGARER